MYAKERKKEEEELAFQNPTHLFFSSVLSVFSAASVVN